MKPILIIKNITKKYAEENGEELLALDDISLEIYEGEIFAIVGPSGAGKSTLLRIISGLDKSYSGSCVYAEGLSGNETSFVFQKFALLPWLSIEENVSLNLVSKKLPKEKVKKLVLDELKSLGLEKFAKNRPKELSGGMQQRVGLARALVRSPKIIFMDEPLSELDIFTAKDLREKILQIWHDRKPTIVMVTHNISDAIEMADRIAVLTKTPGRLEKIIENKLKRPRVLRSKEFYDLEDELTKLITS